MSYLCWKVVMLWPGELPDTRNSRLFAWALAKAGEYANREARR